MTRNAFGFFKDHCPHSRAGSVHIPHRELRQPQAGGPWGLVCLAYKAEARRPRRGMQGREGVVCREDREGTALEIRFDLP